MNDTVYFIKDFKIKPISKKKRDEAIDRVIKSARDEERRKAREEIRNGFNKNLEIESITYEGKEYILKETVLNELGEIVVDILVRLM